VGSTLSLVDTGEIRLVTLGLLFALILGVIAFVVLMEKAQRRIAVNYAKRGKNSHSSNSYLPFKINQAGVIPPIFASSIILFPATIGGWLSQKEGLGWIADVTAYMAPGQPLYILVYGLAIIGFTFFYTALTFDAKETADNLQKSGGFIPGIRPGENSANYIDAVVSRLTASGSLYIAAVCLIPEFLILLWNVPFYFGGTSILIIVVVTIDFLSQFNNYQITNEYKNLMNVRGFN
jgi:preprotein translocase subunit SecY